MLKMISVSSVLLLASTAAVFAQTPAPAAVVTAETIDATMKASIAANTLDKKMSETPIKGGIVRVGMIHRTRDETRALMHAELTEVYQIISGSATLVTGGTTRDTRPVSDPPNLGALPSYSMAQEGGIRQRVKAKDVVVIPAGLPHRLIELDGPIEYVIFRFEVTPK